jgi:tetratricopeptide (TPR) repeat protein/predicted Ser/Thr protein kinase
MIGRTLSHYRIIDKLGEGGMGTVWKAEDTTLRRLVAIKALSSQLAENREARERFIREAQAASALNHASITTVHELLEDNGEQFIVMEYVEGKTIRDIIESGHVSIRKAIDIIQQAAEALDTAHTKGILHRDIKSSNIMVSMEGRVKVMDFGLAHLEERSQLTRTGTTMGTLAYSSPEQLTGRDIDKRSEIWSLGVVFYELLTGQLPFKSPSEGELVFAIINNEQDKPSKIRDDVPESVCAVINRMLLKQPELRYQNCGELISDLNAIRGELETTTVTISPVYDSTQVRARRRTIVSVAAGAVAIAGLLALWFLFLAPKPAGPPSVAILSFEEIGLFAGEEWFAYAITDETGSRLSAISGLLIKQIYAFDYNREGKSPAQMGDELDTDYLLSAVIQREFLPDGNSRVRLTPRLVRTSDGSSLPVQICEGTFKDGGLYALEADLAEQVAAALDVALLATERGEIREILTDNEEALSVYLKGLDHRRIKLDREATEKAIACFEQAVALDPDFAEAHAHLASAYSWYPWNWGNGAVYHPKAEAALQKAGNLKPDTPELHYARGDYYLYAAGREFEEAIAEYRQVLRSRPNDTYALNQLGVVFMRQGNWDDAVAAKLRVLEINPIDFNALSSLGHALAQMRRYGEAEHYLEKAIHLYPEQSLPYTYLVCTYLMQGKTDAIQSFREEHEDIFGSYWVSRGLGDYRHKPLQRIFPEYFDLSMGNLVQRATDVIISFQPHQALSSKALLDSARIDLEGDAEILGFSHNLALALGFIYASLGVKSEAIAYGKQAVDIMSVEDDADTGPRCVAGLTEIYVMVGEFDAAIDQLEIMLSIPSYWSVPLLEIDPMWDPLRDHPRFQALLEKYR